MPPTRHPCAHVCSPDRETLPIQLVAQHARAHERGLLVQCVKTTYQGQIGRADRHRHIVDAAPAEPCQLCLAADRQGVGGVHHRIALRHPTLVSAPAQQSCSSVSGPTLACKAFRSTGGSAGAVPPPNRSAARSLSCRFHSIIWLGCTSNRWASSASVFSPPIAANATWALNTAE
jgi:hypothetical protein